MRKIPLITLCIITLVAFGAPIVLASIALNPTSLDFGVVNIGDSSTQYVEIQNVGSSGLSISITHDNGSSEEFSFTPPILSYLDPGGITTIQVTYAPDDVGPDTGGLEIQGSDGSIVPLDLSGEGVGISVNPSSLDFGAVSIGASSTQTVVITNLGESSLSINSITRANGTSAEFSYTDPDPENIDPGGSSTIEVTYAPVDAELDTGGLEIAGDDGSLVTLGLSGKGVGISVNPASLNFGAVSIGASSTQNVVIQNQGDSGDLSVTAELSTTTDSVHYSFTDPDPAVIAPGGSSTIAVTFAPQAVGLFYADLNINNEVWVSLEGQGLPECESDEQCDDGLWCNGAETCDTGTGTCLPGMPPDCDDGVFCTDDYCDEAVDDCVYSPNDENCDDGLFCNGVETCNPDSGCFSGIGPCEPLAEFCDEVNDMCTPVGGCQSDDDCDDGLFCNGEETCAAGTCEPAAGPCDPVTEKCDEANDVCVSKGSQAKVVICHIPPDNPSKPKTLSVAEEALPAHLAHGDSRGPCP